VAERKALTAAASIETSDETSRQAAIEQSVSAIGPRVREQRRARGLSLQQAATLAGVSAASIHKVERGDMVPTVTTLLKLAAAFELPLSSFVDDTLDEATGPQVVREADRTAVASPWPGTVRASVTTGTGPFRLVGEVLEVAAGASGELAADPAAAERLWYVIDGSLEVTTGGAPVVARAGDTLQLRGDRPVSWRNTSRCVARTLQVSVPRERS
jgi:transcriptional regulator with XRE-family HTH domain